MIALAPKVKEKVKEKCCLKQRKRDVLMVQIPKSEVLEALLSLSLTRKISMPR